MGRQKNTKGEGREETKRIIIMADKCYKQESKYPMSHN